MVNKMLHFQSSICVAHLQHYTVVFVAWWRAVGGLVPLLSGQLVLPPPLLIAACGCGAAARELIRRRDAWQDPRFPVLVAYRWRGLARDSLSLQFWEEGVRGGLYGELVWRGEHKLAGISCSHHPLAPCYRFCHQSDSFRSLQLGPICYIHFNTSASGVHTYTLIYYYYFPAPTGCLRLLWSQRPSGK